VVDIISVDGDDDKVDKKDNIIGGLQSVHVMGIYNNYRAGEIAIALGNKLG